MMTNIVIELHFICWMLSININKIVFFLLLRIIVRNVRGEYFLSIRLYNVKTNKKKRKKRKKTASRAVCLFSVFLMQMFLCFLSHCPLQTEVGFCNSSLTVFHSPSPSVVSGMAGLDSYNVVLCTDSFSLPRHAYRLAFPFSFLNSRNFPPLCFQMTINTVNTDTISTVTVCSLTVVLIKGSMLCGQSDF